MYDTIRDFIPLALCLKPVNCVTISLSDHILCDISIMPIISFHLAACEGTLCCSTCHLIVAEEDFDSIPDVLSDEEIDMLDTAENLTPT